MYERDVPNVARNVANFVPTKTGANGTFCKAGSLRCTAPEYAVVNYLNRTAASVRDAQKLNRRGSVENL
jgi:hypothetical protein